MGSVLVPLSPEEVPSLAPEAEVASTLAAFLASRESPHTVRCYRHHNETALALLGLKTLAEIQPGHLVAYRSHIMLGTRGLAAKSQALSALRSFLSWAAGLGGVALRVDQILTLLNLPRVKVLTPYLTLTAPEIRRFLAAARASGPRDLALGLVFIGAGLRVSEVAALDCRDLLEDTDGQALLHVRLGKGGRDRFVPVREEVGQAVRAYLAHTGRRTGAPEPLFLANEPGSPLATGPRITPKHCNRTVKALCAEARITKRISCHSLRHTFAIASLRHSKDLFAVSKLLGHSALSTTQRYVNHLELGELRLAIPEMLVGLDPKHDRPERRRPPEACP